MQLTQMRTGHPAQHFSFDTTTNAKLGLFEPAWRLFGLQDPAVARRAVKDRLYLLGEHNSASEPGKVTYLRHLGGQVPNPPLVWVDKALATVRGWLRL